MNVEGNVAAFLQDRTGSGSGKWRGRLSAAEQRLLFGKILTGKREVEISGEKRTIKVKRTVCFGTDFEIQEWSFDDFKSI